MATCQNSYTISSPAKQSTNNNKIDNILSDHTQIENGLPQGSVINVTLLMYNTIRLMINAILSNIRKPVKYILLADCNIYRSGIDTRSTTNTATTLQT